MGDFSWWTAFFVFLAFCSTDCLFSVYSEFIVRRKILKAANIGAVLYLLGAFGVTSYIRDWRYVIPIVLGGWIGTWISFEYQNWAERKPRVIQW